MKVRRATRAAARSDAVGEPRSREGSPAERYRLAMQHGESGTAFLALYDGWEHFHPTSQSGFIAFERHGGVALALGEPVCSRDVALAAVAAFEESCRSNGLVPAFVATSGEFATAARDAGWAIVKIGEEPLFSTEGYAPRGNRTKKVRSAANQARRAGVVIEVVPPDERPSLNLSRQMEEVLRMWRDSRNVKTLGFALRLAPLAFARDKVIITARTAARLEAFITCVPYRNGQAYYVEDLIRRPDAVKGVSELLFLQAVEECRARGAVEVNMGLAPLRNCREQPSERRKLGRFLEFAFRRLNVFYNFQSLDHFKGKVAPTRWEEVFLVYPPGQLRKISLALLLAFTPGRFGPALAVLSRFRLRRDADGRMRPPIVLLGGLAAAAAVSLAVRDPDLALDLARQTVGAVEVPLFAAEGVARGHLLVDVIAAIVSGAWFMRANRRQD